MDLSETMRRRRVNAMIADAHFLGQQGESPERGKAIEMEKRRVMYELALGSITNEEKAAILRFSIGKESNMLAVKKIWDQPYVLLGTTDDVVDVKFKDGTPVIIQGSYLKKIKEAGKKQGEDAQREGRRRSQETPCLMDSWKQAAGAWRPCFFEVKP